MDLSGFPLRALAGALCAALVAGLPVPAAAGSLKPSQAKTASAPTEVLVRFRQETRQGRPSLSAHLGRLSKPAQAEGVHRLQVAPGLSVAEVLTELRGRSDVAYAEPNHILTTQTTEPNDPGFVNQWGLQKIGAPTAWDQQSGSRSLIMAVVDTGIDAAHPALQANLWANQGEIPGNGIDDEGNGYVDDAAGWDFINEDNNPADGQGHGTHVAGIAAATGNDGIGTVGAAWQSSVMAVKALDDTGSGTTLDIARGINYAVAQGARVVNMSLGGDTYSRTLASAITGAPETLFIVAAGNGGTDGVGDDTAVHTSFPCNLSAPNLICVAATDTSDSLASFSNYGSYVDLAAPGTRILSTVPGDRYSYASGTSMATPFVAGAAALVWSAHPGYSVAQVRSAIVDGVEKVPGLENKVRTGGRLHLPGALGVGTTTTPVAQPEPTPTPTPTPSPTPTASPSPASGGGGLPIPNPLPTLAGPNPSASPTASPSPEPTPDATVSPTPSPTAEPDPEVLPDPEPEPPSPTRKLEFELRKRRSGVKVHGALEPGAEGIVKVVLARRVGGTFRKVATRTSLLELVDDGLSIFGAHFVLPEEGRCRITTVFMDLDQKSTARRTFNC